MPWVPIAPPYPPDPWGTSAPGSSPWVPEPNPGVEFPKTLLFDGFARYNGVYFYDGVKHVWHT